MTTNERTVGRYLRWLLAALSVGAGVIHFSVSGEHYDMSWLHGSFFATVAWLQLAWAVGVILRPSRRLLSAGVVLNAGIIGVWAMSRIWGVPIKPGRVDARARGARRRAVVGVRGRHRRDLARRARPPRARGAATASLLRGPERRRSARWPSQSCRRWRWRRRSRPTTTAARRQVTAVGKWPLAMAGHAADAKAHAAAEATPAEAPKRSSVPTAARHASRPVSPNAGNSGHGHRGPVPVPGSRRRDTRRARFPGRGIERVRRRAPDGQGSRGRRVPPDHAVRAVHRRALHQGPCADEPVRPGRARDRPLRRHGARQQDRRT